MSYYLWIGEQEQGPYSIEELQHSLNAGEIGLDQMVRLSDSADWVSVGQVVSAASVSNRSQIQPQVEPPARRSVLNVPRGILLGAGGVAVVGLISMVFTTCGSGQSGEVATAPAEPSESQPVSAKLAIAAKTPEAVVNESDPRFAKAALFRQHGLTEDSKRELILILTEKGDDAPKAKALYLLGMIAFDQNQILLALETWQELVATYPESEDAKLVKERINELAQIVGESQKESLNNAVAEAYLRHADFWSRGKSDVFSLDTSWIPNVDAAVKWFDKTIAEFPQTTAARVAYEQKMKTLLGWEDPGQYGDKHGVKASPQAYIPRLVATFNQFAAEFPDAATVPAFRFQIAQAYWSQKDWENAKKWLNSIIQERGSSDTFYVDLAKRRLEKLEY
jgi:tetratricopeptide (TPR) repeat protein